MRNNDIEKDVIYIASDEVAKSYKWFDYSDKLSPNVQIISIEDISIILEKGYNLPRKIIEGTVLVRSPFDCTSYFDINKSEDLIIREKISGISKIAQQLGARKLIGSVEFTEEEILEKDINGNIHYKAVDIDMRRKIEEQERCQKRYQLEVDFPIAKYTDETYSKAMTLYKQYNMYEDVEVRDLIDMRKPGELNPLGRQKVHLSLLSEVNNSKDFAASLTVMGGVFKIGASTQKTVSTKKH